MPSSELRNSPIALSVGKFEGREARPRTRIDVLSQIIVSDRIFDVRRLPFLW